MKTSPSTEGTAASFRLFSILALLPVLTSTGRGSDVMVPMAIPSFGGMLIEILTMLIAPVLYSAYKERQFLRAKKRTRVLLE